ncbi:MAG: hypothetical protein AAFQ82_24055, partial [Myxococcota bacterium]
RDERLRKRCSRFDFFFELANALRDEGVSEQYATVAANAVFSVMGQGELRPGDADRLQDAFTSAWLSAAPGRAEALLAPAWGEGPNGLISRLSAQGFSDDFAMSVARVAEQLGRSQNHGYEHNRYEDQRWMGHRGMRRFMERRFPWLAHREHEHHQVDRNWDNAFFRARSLAHAINEGTEGNVPANPGVVATLTHPSGIQITTPVLANDGVHSPFAVDLSTLDQPPLLTGAFGKLLDADENQQIRKEELSVHLTEQGMPEDEAEALSDALFATMGMPTLFARDLAALQTKLVRAWVTANPTRAEHLLHVTGNGQYYGHEEVHLGLQRLGWSPANAKILADLTVGSQGHTQLWRGQAEQRIKQLAHDPSSRALAESMEVASLFVQAHLREQAAQSVSELLESTLGLSAVAPVFTTARTLVPNLLEAERPPEVAEGLIDALVRADANEDRGLDASELIAYFTDSGFPQEAAENLA